MSQQESFPRDRSPGWWSTILKNVRLGWRLLRDPMVPTWTKLIPLGAALYVVLPTDLVPDILLGFGQLDDLGVLVLGLRTFIGMCPKQIVQAHLAAMSSVEGSYHIVEEEPPSPHAAGYLEAGSGSPADETVPPIVEGTAKPTDPRS
jgi:uncharacterized membrane protein YkvA (DUF1232 family)